MALSSKQFRQIESAYFGIVKGKENLAEAHRNGDADLIEQYKEYVSSTRGQLAELLPPDLADDDKQALETVFEQLSQMTDNGEKDSAYYKQVEGYVDAILPGFTGRNANRTEPAAPSYQETISSSTAIVSSKPDEAAVVLRPQQIKSLQFTESLSAVTQNVEQIKGLFEDIEAVSSNEVYELNKLKNQPRIDKASKREYKKRIRAYKRSHDRFVGKKISKGLACFMAVFLGIMLFIIELFALLLVAEVTLTSESKMPVYLANYLHTYYKDITPIMLAPKKGDTFADWELFTVQEYDEWKQFRKETFIGWENFRDGGYKNILERHISKSTVLILVVLAALSFWPSFALGRNISMQGFTIKQFNGLKIPLFTPDNRRRQVEIEHISRTLGKQVPKLVRTGNSLLSAEYRKKQWNETLMEHMSTIDNFGKSVRKLTLRGQIREVKRASRISSGVTAGGLLAMLGIVLVACVGLAAAVALPSEHEITWSDGSKTREWR
jgi:hypothetical protein